MKARRLTAPVVVALLALSFTAGDAAARPTSSTSKPDLATLSLKKRNPGPRTITVSKAANEQIPDATAAPFSVGLLTSTIELAGKKLRNKQIRDVNVTFQTTGSAPGAASQVVILLSSPSGATVTLAPSLAGQSIGPLTIDDESDVAFGFGTGTPREPTILQVPYQGTAQPGCIFSFQGCALSAMDYSPVAGSWTLRAYDNSPAGPATSVLNGWSVTVIAGKRFRTK